MDVITEITKERGRYRVTVGETEEFLVPVSLMRERRLTVGQPLDVEEYDDWLMLRQYRHALDWAVAYLAARARSRHEVEQKLHQAGYRPCTVEMVLYKLERENILDDADFARQWVEARASNKVGSRRIAQELKRKGVNDEEAAAALEDFGEEAQLASAIALAEKAVSRLRPGEDRRKSVSRITAMLMRRGFSWDMSKAALEQVLSDLPDDEDGTDTLPSDTVTDDSERLQDAVALARKGIARAKPGEDTRKTASRVSAMLARRGFPWDIAKEAVQTALNGE